VGGHLRTQTNTLSSKTCKHPGPSVRITLKTHRIEEPSYQDAGPMGETPWRNSTQEDGCHSRSYSH
jgi:hypothetical protein